MTETVANIEDLSLAFATMQGTLHALDGLSFQLSKGETLALLGESGCGKSLTSQAIMRLLPNNALYGVASKIQLDTHDLLSLPECLMRQLRGKRLAMIFQEPMSALNPVLTIGQQLAEVLARNGLPPSQWQERMLALLKEVEMPEPAIRIQQYPHQLSGGQKQRVVIAMALASAPDILIADEPTTALDVTVQAQILALLQRLQAEHHMSMLLITHDLSVVRTVADHVCVMYAGQVVEQSTVQNFFSQVKHPYAQLLLNAVPHLHNRAQRLQAIEGSVPALDAMPEGCRFHPRCPHAFSPCAKEKPSLIDVDTAKVRCHLYPSGMPAVIQQDNTVSRTEKRGKPERLLEVRDLCVSFPARKDRLGRTTTWIHAVKNLSFQLETGKTLALVGESGCGKTTTSRAIMQLQAYQSGSILFKGNTLARLSKTERKQFRKDVQIIFQDPFSSMNPRMSVADIISEGMRAQNVPKKAQATRIVELLDQVNLPKTSLHRYPHQFSGGQRQRIGIARALACQPKLLICDEPTSALDVSVQAQILNLLKDLQSALNVAYLFITHDMSVVSYMADDVMVMRRGEMVEQGSITDIIERPQARYTQSLMASILGEKRPGV